MRERADVVVVGARMAGCALAAPLARAGRRVVVIDRAAFPSDTLSTHVLFPAGVAELAAIGALPRILALDPARPHRAALHAEGVRLIERMRPVDGIDYGLCVPRDQQDVCLVEAVREHGAEVREHCTFTALRWAAGRVAGISYRDADGAEREIDAQLVVGADGRRSSVAAAVGAYQPYRFSRNGRGLVWRYMDDPGRETLLGDCLCQWREGDSFAFAFPCTPKERMIVLFMGHRDEVSAARSDAEGYWRRKLDGHPGVRERLTGLDETTYTKVRSTAETPAYFRASSGPGWALAGDAGHFKDPVTGQGMRDSMWMGRTLAERVLPALDDAAAIDRATRAWEAERDRHCLPAYHFANADTRVERQSPALIELLRSGCGDQEPDLTDLFGRARTPQQIATLPRLGRALGAALWRGERPRRETLRRAGAELRVELAVRREARRDEFRPARPIPGSDHPGAVFKPPSGRGAGSSAPVEEPVGSESVGA